MAPLLNDFLGRTRIIIIGIFEQVMAGFKCFKNNITSFMFNPLSKTRYYLKNRTLLQKQAGFCDTSKILCEG